jgi:ribosomal protein S19
MVGFKFGEFIKTRVTYNINKKKKRKKNKWVKNIIL